MHPSSGSIRGRSALERTVPAGAVCPPVPPPRFEAPRFHAPEARKRLNSDFGRLILSMYADFVDYAAGSFSSKCLSLSGGQGDPYPRWTAATVAHQRPTRNLKSCTRLRWRMLRFLSSCCATLSRCRAVIAACSYPRYPRPAPRSRVDVSALGAPWIAYCFGSSPDDMCRLNGCSIEQPNFLEHVTNLDRRQLKWTVSTAL